MSDAPFPRIEVAGAAVPPAWALWERFLIDLTGLRPRLELADLGGAGRVGADGATSDMAAVARTFIRSALSYPPFRGRAWRRDLPGGLRETLEGWETARPSLSAMARELSAYSTQV